MRAVGILGGMGPEATAALYLKLIRRCQAERGASNDENFPTVVLFNLPVPDMVGARPARNELLRALTRAGRAAEDFGATCIAIPCCTAHILEADLRREFRVPLISIVEQVVGAVAATGARSVGLLGTRATVESRLFDEPLAEIGVETVAHPDQGAVTALIRKVMAGKAGPAEREALLAMASHLEAQGAEAVVLGCTELPLLLENEPLGGALVDPLSALADGVMRHLEGEWEVPAERATGPAGAASQGATAPA